MGLECQRHSDQSVRFSGNLTYILPRDAKILLVVKEGSVEPTPGRFPIPRIGAQANVLLSTIRAVENPSLALLCPSSEFGLEEESVVPTRQCLEKLTQRPFNLLYTVRTQGRSNVFELFRQPPRLPISLTVALIGQGKSAKLTPEQFSLSSDGLRLQLSQVDLREWNQVNVEAHWSP